MRVTDSHSHVPCGDMEREARVTVQQGTAPLRGTGRGEGKQGICRHCMTTHMAGTNNGGDFSLTEQVIQKLV